MTNTTIDIKGTAQKCKDHSQELRPGSGPHAYRLWCKVCNKHTQWVNATQALAIANLKELL